MSTKLRAGSCKTAPLQFGCSGECSGRPGSRSHGNTSRREPTYGGVSIDICRLAGSVRRRKPGMKFDKEFHLLKKRVILEKGLVHSKLLDPNNPKSSKKRTFTVRVCGIEFWTRTRIKPITKWRPLSWGCQRVGNEASPICPADMAARLWISSHLARATTRMTMTLIDRFRSLPIPPPDSDLDISGGIRNSRQSRKFMRRGVISR